MGPQALRMNLNTLARHGVFAHGSHPDWPMIDYVTARIGDAEEIRRSRQFPYQYLAAYKHAAEEVPEKIKAELHRAAEVACGNVPRLAGPVVIGLDVSGSMSSAVTGHRGRGATSAMRCVDVAALFAAAILRRSPDSIVIPFDTQAYDARLDAGDTILSLATRLAAYGGGGTDCSIPLREANTRYAKRRFAGVVLVSDSESWVYAGRAFAVGRSGATGVIEQWQQFVRNQQRLGGHGIPAPKLACIDLQPYATTQAPERDDILNIGGFSDAVFQMVSAFFAPDPGRFVAEVEAIEL
jgi:60 kDa SS-A/Ro ribonucleoprotein